jgi:hypothetical protein
MDRLMPRQSVKSQHGSEPTQCWCCSRRVESVVCEWLEYQLDRVHYFCRKASLGTWGLSRRNHGRFATTGGPHGTIKDKSSNVDMSNCRTGLSMDSNTNDCS